MPNDTSTIPPPPDVESAVPSVPHTTAEKVVGGIGSRATAFAQGLSGLSGSSMHPFDESSVGKSLGQHYSDRLSQARRHYENAQTYGNVLGSGEIDPQTGEPTGVDPQTGKPLTPEQRQQYKQMAEGAWGDYQKIAGTSKESKQALQQKKGLFDVLVTKGHKALAGLIDAHGKATGAGSGAGGAGGGQGGAGGTQQPGGMPPPPSPGSDSGGPAGAAAGPSGASGAIPPPPAPLPAYNEQSASQAPALRQEMADNRTIEMDKRKQQVISDAKIREEQAKPSPSKSTPASDAYFSMLDQTDPETGEKYTPQKALKVVTDASAKAGKPTPFQEYMADPKNYDKFQSEMAKAKGSGKSASAGIGAVYGIYRMLEMGYKQNPEILPIVAQLAPQVFANAGMKIPPSMAEALGKVPLDQPLSPVTGAPIGTSMPGAPTAGTRTQAQTAARIITGDPESGASPIADIRKEIKDLAGYLGPAEGRYNVKYLLGKAGSTGDPDKDKKLSQLRTDLTFLASAAAKFHLNSVRAMEQFETLADSGKDSAAALGGFIDSVEKWAGAAQRQERGAGETNMAPPPSAKGATTKFTDGGRTYNIPSGQVAEFKKDHPNASASAR